MVGFQLGLLLFTGYSVVQLWPRRAAVSAAYGDPWGFYITGIFGKEKAVKG